MKQKRLSYPPFVVFFDTLAIILFLLILNQNENPVDIEIPNEKVFEGGEVLYRENGGLYDKSGAKHQSDKHEYRLSCGEQSQCNQAKLEHPNADEFYILLPDKLFEEISKFTLIVLRTTSCKSIKYVINDNGELKLDQYTMSDKQYECFSKIDGFKELVKK